MRMNAAKEIGVLIIAFSCLGQSRAQAVSASEGFQQIRAREVSQELSKLSQELIGVEASLGDWSDLNRYRKENANLPPPMESEPRVVFYGDSITDAWGRLPDTGEFFPGKPYVNRGISGETTPQMLVRFSQDVVHLKPAVVLVLAGINDIAGNTGPSTPEMIEDNFAAMAAIAKQNGIKMVIASILPSNRLGWAPAIQPAEEVRQINLWLRNFCTTNGLVYLNYYDALVDSHGGMRPELSADGVHPTGLGYAVMAPLAERAIAQALGEKTVLEMPSPFSNHMVLQSGMQIPVWGKATPGVLVSVEFSGEQAEATADSLGNWRVQLNPLPASASPEDLKIIAGDAKLILHDVLVGEVWLCSGQSNMYFPLGKVSDWGDGAVGGEEEISAPEQPNIRLFSTSSAEWRASDLTGWQRANPISRQDFSAVCWFFGKRLSATLKVPIGLISISVGGSSIQLWMSPEAYAKDPVIQKYSEINKQHEKEIGAYNKEVDEWVEKYNAGDKEAKRPNPLPHELEVANFFDGTELFDRWIAPVSGYALRGVTWYQGETNAVNSETAQTYFPMLEELIRSWRAYWRQENMPWYIVQLPDWGDGKNWPLIRQAELEGSQRIPDVGLAVTVGLGDVTNLHPVRKREVGERLAAQALAKTYHESVTCSGPSVSSITAADDKLRLKFETGDSPLVILDNKWNDVQVAGVDGVFHDATAQIRGNEALIASPDVAKPVAIRYGWKAQFVPSLFNTAGFPASPFSLVVTAGGNWRLEEPDSAKSQE